MIINPIQFIDLEPPGLSTFPLSQVLTIVTCQKIYSSSQRLRMGSHTGATIVCDSEFFCPETC
jgi:hypothetical protein